jgi:predicted nucleic acid-binding protein
MAGDARSECTVGEIAAPIRNALVGGPFGSDLVSDDYVATGVPVIRGANMDKVAGWGALLLAKKRTLIPALRPLLLQVQSAGCFLSTAIIEAACESAGE